MKDRWIKLKENLCSARGKKISFLVLSMVLVCAVAFGTAYNLIKPAVALENDNAYVTDESRITGMETAGATLDAESAEEKAGKDNSADDKYLRSFDTVTYNIGLKFAKRTETDSAKLRFLLIIPEGKNDAQFEPNSFLWVKQNSADYIYNTANSDYQFITGSYSLSETDFAQDAQGLFIRSIVVRALKMQNGDELRPIFIFWLDGNTPPWGDDENAPTADSVDLDWITNIIDKREEYNDNPCLQHGKEYQVICPDEVIISAAPSYNIAIVTGGNVTRYTADFSQQNPSESALDADAGEVYGQLFNYGIRLQIVGDNNKGLIGVEFPSEESQLNMTFKLTVDSCYTYTPEGSTEAVNLNTSKTYRPLFYSFSSSSLYRNKYYPYTGSEISVNGRELPSSIALPYTASIPANSPSNANNNYRSCYNGGTWSAQQKGNELTVSVNGAEFDFSNMMDYDVNDMGGASFISYKNDNNEYADYTQYWERPYVDFSAGELWLFQQLPLDDSEQILGYERVSDTAALNDPIAEDETPVYASNNTGTFTIRLTDEALTVTQVDGKEEKLHDEKEPQSIDSDDTGSTSIFVTTGVGRFVQRTNYYRDRYNYLTDGCGENGMDWILRGNTVYIRGSADYSGGYLGYSAVAIDVLVKFDNNFFSPDPEAKDHSIVGVWDGATILFGGLKDRTNAKGEVYKGWNHYDAAGNEYSIESEEYDAEMEQATADDLVFFSSLSELEAKGYTCVAMLCEWRGPFSKDHVKVMLYAKGKNNAQTSQAGKVYEEVESSALWTKNDLARISGISIEKILAMDDSELKECIEQYIPSKTAGKKYSEYQPSVGWSGKVGDPLYNGDLYTYTKAYYDENGKFEGGTGGYFWGDSCLVVDYVTSITNSVAQRTDTNAVKDSFDLDHQQRIVDYVLQPAVTRAGTLEASGQSIVETFEITVTLPKGLSYIKGSSYLGGTYNQSTPLGKQGTVTDGEQITPTVTTNENGEQVLTYSVRTELNGDKEILNLAPIYFSCGIGDLEDPANDVKNADSLTTTATISSSHDVRVQNETNKNLAKTTINISKGEYIGLAKRAEINFLDVNDQLQNGMGFTVYINNHTNQEAENVVALDVMPYNNDSNGSAFDGNLILTKLTVTDADASSFNFYYTEDTSVRGKTVDGYSVDNINAQNGWTLFEIAENTDGSFELKIPKDNFSPTAIIVVGNLAAQSNVKLNMRVKLPDGKPDDIVRNAVALYANGFTLEDNDFCRILARSIEGLVWNDKNIDGIRKEDADTHIDGVKVELLKIKDGGDPQNIEDYTEVCGTTATGKQLDLLNDTETEYKPDGEAGHYKFINVPEGNYAIRFSSGDTVIAAYRASPVDRGSDDSIDSDANPSYSDNGELLKAEIVEIKMPSASEITPDTANSDHNDLGVYLGGNKFLETGGPGTLIFTIAGASLLLIGMVALIIYSYKTRKGRRSERQR